MLKTLSTKSAKLRKGKARVGGDSRAKRDGNKLDRSEIDDIEVDGNKVGEDEVRKKGRKMSKFKNLSKSKKTVRSDFLTLGTRLAFTTLRQAFVKASIFNHFHLERHTRFKTDISGYALGEILSQLTSDDLGRWYLITFFLQKMIPAKTRYETHDDEFLAIVEAFKTWKHYLERSQYKVLVFIDYNNLRQFMKMKSLSSKQVCWAQKLSCYHFRIDYQ